MLSKSGEEFAAGYSFVSGDWRSSRWCTVEVSLQRLWCKSVMSVREKCDEKSWRSAVVLGSVESQPLQSAREVTLLTCPAEYSGAQVSAQKTGANPGHRALREKCARSAFHPG